MMLMTTTQVLPNIVAELLASLCLREYSRWLFTLTVVAATLKITTSGIGEWFGAFQQLAYFRAICVSALRRCIDVMRDIHHAKNRYSANTVFSETKIMQAGRTEDEELKQQRRMKVMTDVTKKKNR